MQGSQPTDPQLSVKKSWQEPPPAREPQPEELTDPYRLLVEMERAKQHEADEEPVVFIDWPFS